MHVIVLPCAFNRSFGEMGKDEDGKWRKFSSHENGSTATSNISDSICPSNQQTYVIIWFATVCVSFALVFPIFIAILKELARRRWCPGHRTSTNASSSSSDILLCNLALFSIANLFFLLIHSLMCLGVNVPPPVFMVCFTASMVGGSFASMAISLDCYLAVVHPVMYMIVKRLWRFPLVLGTLNWLYTVVMVVVIVSNNLKMYSPVLVFPVFTLIPPYIFLNVSTLITLRLAGPERRRLADLCPAKRRAFWLILFTLVTTLMYSCPLQGMLIYQAFSDVEEQMVFCLAIPMMMVIPVLSGTLLFLLIFFTVCRVV